MFCVHVGPQILIPCENVTRNGVQLDCGSTSVYAGSKGWLCVRLKRVSATLKEGPNKPAQMINSQQMTYVPLTKNHQSRDLLRNRHSKSCPRAQLT
jgi:hypothetical protein